MFCFCIKHLLKTSMQMISSTGFNFMQRLPVVNWHVYFPCGGGRGVEGRFKGKSSHMKILLTKYS